MGHSVDYRLREEEVLDYFQVPVDAERQVVAENVKHNNFIAFHLI